MEKIESAGEDKKAFDHYLNSDFLNLIFIQSLRAGMMACYQHFYMYRGLIKYSFQILNRYMYTFKLEQKFSKL